MAHQHHHHPHHHRVVPLARISLTLSRHFSLSFLASGRPSGLHLVCSHRCCMYVQAVRPALSRPYVGVHRSTSLMSSFLLLQQCPACLVRLTRIVFVMAGRWPYSWCFVECCCQDLFNIARNVLVYLLLEPFCLRLSGASIQQYRHDRCLEETAFHFIGHMIDSLSIAVPAFVSRVSMSFSVDETAS